MELRARLVLGDCRKALADLHDDLPRDEWRRQWILVLTLLRAVGHVLEKVDGARGSSARSVICAAWERPKPPIFTEFIDKARNLALKEYEIQVSPITWIRGGVVHRVNADGTETLVANDPVELTKSYSVSVKPHVGRHPRELADEAIAWWDQYLSTIEAQLQTCRKPPVSTAAVEGSPEPAVEQVRPEA